VEVMHSPATAVGDRRAATPAAQAARKPATIDFNSLLIVANIVVAILIVQGWAYRGDNEYVDVFSVLLGIALCGQNIVALAMERRSRDPFVILLVFILTFYFALRIYTLFLYPFSIAFIRFPYYASDSNYALVFILVANVFLYAGLRAAPSAPELAVDLGNWRAVSTWRAVLLLLAAIAFTYVSVSLWTPENIPRAINFVVLFLSQHIVILLALSYYILFRRTFPTVAAVAIALLVATEIVLSVLFGSRSAIVTTIQTCMLVLLAIYGSMRVRATYLAGFVVSLPLLFFLMGVSFVIATHNRQNKETGASLTVSQAAELSQQGAATLSEDRDLDIILPPIFSRGGFFDFAAELIAHRDEYSSIFTLSTYYKSIVDNLLTPGFDVYDQPKIGNALEFVYQAMGDPSKEVAEEFYQSDQLEIYGEYYALYAYASLPLFFLTAWLVKRTYARLHAKTPYMLTMKRVVVLFIWVETINSFGLDWLAGEVVPVIGGILIWRYFFASKLFPQASPGRARGRRTSVPALAPGGT
jgi:hypothetical protein